MWTFLNQFWTIPPPFEILSVWTVCSCSILWFGCLQLKMILMSSERWLWCRLRDQKWLPSMQVCRTVFSEYRCTVVTHFRSAKKLPLALAQIILLAYIRIRGIHRVTWYCVVLIALYKVDKHLVQRCKIITLHEKPLENPISHNIATPHFFKKSFI